MQYAIEYIDGLANKPVGINADMKEVKIQYTRFENLLIAAKKQYDEDLKAAGGTVAGGVAAGVGVAALAPTAAMAIATTRSERPLLEWQYLLCLEQQLLMQL